MVVVVLIVHAVAVGVVPELALPVAIRIGAVIVLHVVVFRFILTAIVGQCEWGDLLLAWTEENGSSSHGWELVREVVEVIPDSDVDSSIAVVRRYLKLSCDRVVLGGAVEFQVSWIKVVHEHGIVSARV